MRVKASPVVVTKRDVEVLTLIGLCKFMTTAQVARAIFPSEDRCRRRLRRLFDAGLVAVTLGDSASPNLYSLTKQGVAAVADHDLAVVPRLRLAGSIRLSAAPHALAVVDVRLYLAALEEHGEGELLAWESGSSGLAREAGLVDCRVEPDALVELRLGEGVRRVAVEVDCGTETATVLGSKFSRYVGPLRAGDVDEIWFVVVAGVKRQAHIAALAESAGVGRSVRVFAHEHTLARPVLPLPRGTSGDTKWGEAPNSGGSAMRIRDVQREVAANHPARDRRVVGRVVR